MMQTELVEESEASQHMPAGFDQTENMGESESTGPDVNGNLKFPKSSA
jgi:hypothetical protein